MYARILKKRDYGNYVTYLLDNGKEFSLLEAIGLIESREIYNATVVNSGNTQYIRGKKCKIPVEKVVNGNYDNIETSIYTDTNNKLPNRNKIAFERDIYSKLEYWVNSGSDKILMVQGARQVGKTYLLRKLGKEKFKYTVYINLKTESLGTKFNSVINNISKKIPYTHTEDELHHFWYNVFKNFDLNFEDSEDTLIILDEIQDNVSMFNRLRDIRLSMNCKIAVTGSYLGFASRNKYYFIPTGDCVTVEVNTLSYVEFLKALKLYDKYASIREFSCGRGTHEQVL